jgi:PBP1b-binding outer membrane lipoprotein LpoB
LTAPWLFAGCSPGFEGEYSDPAKEEIVDDRWNETDARKTAQVLIKSMLEKPWYQGYQKRHKKNPIVIVDDILLSAESA